jgi:hypothetical protein
MYLCVRDIDFASFYNLLMDFNLVFLCFSFYCIFQYTKVNMFCLVIVNYLHARRGRDSMI